MIKNCQKIAVEILDKKHLQWKIIIFSFLPHSSSSSRPSITEKLTFFINSSTSTCTLKKNMKNALPHKINLFCIFISLYIPSTVYHSIEQKEKMSKLLLEAPRVIPTPRANKSRWRQVEVLFGNVPGPVRAAPPSTPS